MILNRLESKDAIFPLIPCPIYFAQAIKRPGTYTVQVVTKDSNGNEIDSGTSATYQIKQIGTGDIADNAVTSAKIGSGQVGTTDLADNSVTTTNQFSSKLADNSVITSKIQDNAVTTPKIADDSITSTKIQDGQVGTSDLAPGAVSLTLFERSSELMSLAPGESGTATASCAPGEMLSGGGFFTDTTSASVIIVSRSSQAAFNTWGVDAFNYAGSAGNFRAEAECLAVTP